MSGEIEEENSVDVEEEVDEKEEFGGEGDISMDEIEDKVDDVDDRVTDTMVGLFSEMFEVRSDFNVYIALRELETGTVEDIAEKTGLYPKKVENILDDLEERGIVESFSDGEGTKYSVVPTFQIAANISEKMSEGIGKILDFSGGRSRRIFEAGSYRFIVEKTEEKTIDEFEDEEEDSEELDTSF